MKKSLLLSFVFILTLLLSVGPRPVVAGATDGFFVIADFEAGYPDGFVAFADSWDGSGSSTTIAMDMTNVELPTVPGDPGNMVVSVEYNIAASGSWGGGPGYGGVTHDFAATQDWSGYAAFTFWFHGSNSGAAMRVELKSDGADAANSNRYEYTFTDDVVGWRFFNLPWSDFTARTDFNPGPNPSDPLNLGAVWGYSILLPGGAVGSLYLDQVALTSSMVVADFEAGVPDGFVPFADSWDGSGSSTTLVMDTANVALPTVPPDAGNTVISVDYNIAASGSWGGGPGYGGVTQDFAATQDWSNSMTFSFWFHGSNSGADLRVELKSDGADAANSNRYEFTFTDDVAGWRFFNLPWSEFTRRYDFNPGPSPDDSINLAAMWGYSILLPGGAAGSFYFDQVSLFSSQESPIIDDFEDGVAPGTPCAPGQPPLGFCTFSGAGSSVTLSNPTTPPAPELPVVGTPNKVLQMDVDVTSFAGFIHGFTNDAGDTWVPQDWSTSKGISIWMYGLNSGSGLFIDILDNRNPGSESDDAERWTVAFIDNFNGWKLIKFPFSSFTRKEIGNGAPNDGLGLFEMHGYAIGTLGTGGPKTFFVDEVALYGIAEPPALAVQFSVQNTFIDEGTTGQVGVKLNRPMGPDDPAEVRIDFATERSNAIPYEEFTPTSGTLTFLNGGPSEQFFPIETFDDTKFEGDEQIIIRLTNPVDVERGALFQGSALIADNDPFDPDLLDDFEQGAYLWESSGPVMLNVDRRQSSDPNARPEQDKFENVLVVDVPLHVDIIVEGQVCNNGNGVVPVQLLSTPDFDATTVDHTTVTLGSASEAHVDKKTGIAKRHVEDVNKDGLDDLVFHFRFDDTGLPCNPDPLPFNGSTFDGQPITAGGSDAALTHDFAIGQDWSNAEALSFWYEGSGGGEEITITLKDNRATDPGPSGWELAWSDEFDDPANTPPNPDNWAYEIGDVTPDGKNGWGNEERQYYTDDPANAATDGNGNLVITLDKADGSIECYYGTCEYTSARLLTQNRKEFAYGRIESRLWVPDGRDGLWPAFWSLGTDITRNPWPGAGEIDFMEYVSRLPNEIFGTIHGPGYSGSNSFGGIYDFGEPVYNGYHTFTVEWEPNLITWYVDGIQYHQAEPSDISGPWVFDKPFFLLLNFAIGGNFGGPIDENTTFPQKYLVDYVRVYQGPDTAERFEATFTDNIEGWHLVTIPVTDFNRSENQPPGAPDDGLSLNEVWGYGFAPSEGTSSGTFVVDFVQVVPVPPPTELVVTTLADAGPGSLREAMSLIADGGTITFDPGLAGGTITLTTGQLVANRSMTIDAAAVPGIVISGGNTSRVLEISAGATVSMNDLEVADGVGAPQGGGVLNFGMLNLDRVVVRNNTESSAGPANFQFGGGAIYNGDGATLNLTDSTVRDNQTLNQPGGGVYGFFNSTINITRSTISGNSAVVDVAGGLRSLGNTTIVNSTFSGNTSTAWHGGAIFHTDGQLNVTNSTFTGNTAPAGTAAGIVVATFGGGTPNLTLTNTILANPVGGLNCAIENQGGAGTITSGGGNIDDDGTCNLNAAGDQPNTDPLLGSLADNGGPTLTHALLAGSPAIDAANTAVCPATDQRGITRDAACDVGSFEFVP